MLVVDIETTTRYCASCGETKEIKQFPRNKNKPGGYGHTCKACNSIRAKRHYKDNKEYHINRTSKYRDEHADWYKKYSSSYNAAHKQDHKEWWEQYYAEHKETININNRQWKENNAIKVKAHYILDQALKSGKIIKPDICEICGASNNLEAHHSDYSKPEDVIWVCRKCHLYIHRGHNK